MQREREARERAGFRVDLERPRGADAVRGRARARSRARASRARGSASSTYLPIDAPRMPVATANTAASAGRPPIFSAMPIAIGAVTDFGASDSSVAGDAPSSLREADRADRRHGHAHGERARDRHGEPPHAAPTRAPAAPRARPPPDRAGNARTARRRSRSRTTCASQPAPRRSAPRRSAPGWRADACRSAYSTTSRPTYSDERQREAGERRGREVDPQLEELAARSSALRRSRSWRLHQPLKRERRRGDREHGAHAERHDDRQPLVSSRATCSITPTPAGTNSSDRCWRVRPRGDRHRFRRAAADEQRDSSSTMPAHRPWNGQCRQPHQRLARALEQQQPGETGRRLNGLNAA